MESSAGSVRILIADDHQLFSDGLRTLLTTPHSPFTVIGQVYDGRDVIPVVHQLQPDLILLDINLPHRNGVDIARQLRREFPRIGVIIITMYSYQKLIEELRAVGVAGYLLKSASPERLMTCLNSVVSGKAFYDQLPNEPVIDPRKTDLFVKQFSLTPREIEIIRLIRNGLSNPEIAEQLFLSVETIKTHRKNIYYKLGVNGVAALILFANEQGI